MSIFAVLCRKINLLSSKDFFLPLSVPLEFTKKMLRTNFEKVDRAGDPQTFT